MNTNRYTIGRWVSILYRYGQRYIGKNLELHKIGSGQYIFLLVLYKRNGISQEELSGYLKIDKATTAKAVKKLEEAGYIVRNIDSTDKRAYKVFLTKKARKIKPVIFNALKNWGSILSSGLSKVEQNTILELLRKMAENASEHL